MRLKSVFAFSLFVLLLVNLLGFYIAFILKQEDIKKDVSVLIEKTESKSNASLQFTNSQFAQLSWTTEGKEFQYQGKMYDVVRIERAANTVKIFYEEDTAETQLISDFVKLFTQASDKAGSNGPVKNILLHFLQEFTPQSLWHLADISFQFSASIVYYNCFQPSTFVGGLLCPPPNAAV